MILLSSTEIHLQSLSNTSFLCMESCWQINNSHISVDCLGWELNRVLFRQNLPNLDFLLKSNSSNFKYFPRH